MGTGDRRAAPETETRPRRSTRDRVGSRAVASPSPALIAISTGCPAGIGPEVSVAAAWKLRKLDAVLVGDLATLRAAAKLVGVSPGRLVAVDGSGKTPARDVLRVLEVGPRLFAR